MPTQKKSKGVRSKSKLCSSLRQLLLSETKLLNDRTVAVDVGLLEITEKVSSVTNHLLQTSAAVMVLVIVLEVLGEVLDSVGKKCDLYLRRTCVALVCSVLLNNCLLFVFQHFWYSPFKNIFIKKHSKRWVNAVKQPISENRAFDTIVIIAHLILFVKGFWKNIF